MRLTGSSETDQLFNGDNVYDDVRAAICRLIWWKRTRLLKLSIRLLSCHSVNPRYVFRPMQVSL